MPAADVPAATRCERPYQSRLLTWLNAQAIQGRARLACSLRHLRVWLIWSAQILAYPVYLLAQGARSLGRRLERALAGGAQANPAAPQLLSSDRPIQRTLAAIPAARGLACDRDRRDLVGIAADNCPIAVPPDQQRALQQQLRYELASYYRDLQAQQEQARRHAIPAALTEGDRLLPPLRWFWRAMRWVQCSPVAIAINLFDEARLVPAWQPALPREAPTPLPLLPPLPVEVNLARLDALLARWEHRSLQWGDRLRALSRSALVPARPPAPQPPVPQPVEPKPSSPWLSWEELYGFAEPPLPVWLIAPVRDRQHPTATAALETAADPWLAWEDTYDSAAQLRIDTSAPVAGRQLALTPAAAVRLAPPASVRSPRVPEGLTLAIQPERTNGQEERRAVPPANAAGSASNPEPDPEPKPVRAELDRRPSAEPPPCIDVRAESGGYVKHPLERILAWLDALLYWLEEVAIALWRWLKRRWR